MRLLDFQTALGRLVRAPDGGDPLRTLDLGADDRSRLEALAESPGFRFTVGVQRSWCIRRAANAGYMTLSILPDNLRRRLLDEWTNSGGGTSSFFATEAEALLDFIADRLPHPSHELTACRLEQAALRANEIAARFRAPDLDRLDNARCVVRRGRYAAIVLFYGEPDLILGALLEHRPHPPVLAETTAVLFGPGLDRLYRPASGSEVTLWKRLTAPVAIPVLRREGYRRDVIETMLRAGAVEYA
ncbi:MAG TPA: hypothetical protein VGR73_14945 [Bryobacteraceae bacterium]|nr:hypothetical protein [Bryobacteraceae bacterium]